VGDVLVHDDLLWAGDEMSAKVEMKGGICTDPFARLEESTEKRASLQCRVPAKALEETVQAEIT
jgi:hypothetical protein